MKAAECRRGKSDCLARRKSPVGAGLLANTVGQLESMLNVPTPSRASPLPHLFGGVHKYCAPRKSLWERACSRKKRLGPSTKHPTQIAKNPLSYSPCLHRPPSYASLRLCLQLRQNPPACAPCSWVLLSSCHCLSVVGFSSPVYVSVHESHQSGIACFDGGCAHGTLGCAGFDVITGLLTCAQPPPFRLVARGSRPN